MNTKEFIEKVNKDEELQKKFQGVKDADKFYDIAKANGLTDDLETLKAEVTKYLKENSEISEVDLNSLKEVSGGDFSDVSAAIDYFGTQLGLLAAL